MSRARVLLRMAMPWARVSLGLVMLQVRVPLGTVMLWARVPLGTPLALVMLLAAWMQVLISARLRGSRSWSVPKTQSDDRVIY